MWPVGLFRPVMGQLYLYFTEAEKVIIIIIIIIIITVVRLALHGQKIFNEIWEKGFKNVRSLRKRERGKERERESVCVCVCL